MAVRVDKFEAKAFRGLVDCPLTIGGRSVIVLGENGSGKSSIVDGLEFFFSGRVERFERTQGLSTNESVPHATHVPKDAEISLTFSPGSIRLTRTLAAPPAATDVLAGMLRAGGEAPFILRRSQLLNYIVTRPSERYDRIAELIGIRGLEERELVLKATKDYFEGALEAAKQEHKAATDGLSVALGVPDVAVAADVLSAMNKLRDSAVLPPAVTVDSLFDEDRFPTSPAPAVRQDSLFERASLASAKLPGSADVEIVAQAFAALSLAGVGYKVRVQESQLSLLELLRSGKAQLQGAEEDSCPLCERPIERGVLVASIDKRITELDRLSAEASRFRTTKATAATEANRLADRLADVVRTLGDEVEVRAGVERLSGAAATIRAAAERIQTADFSSDLPSAEILQGLSRESLEAVTVAKASCDSVAQSSQANRSRAVAAYVNAMEALRRHRASVLSLEAESKAAVLSKRVLERFSEVRGAAVGTMYDQILPDLQRYYAKIHPDEQHKDVVLKTIQAKRKSTALEMTSFTRAGRDPRAFSSEAHLDTLGLCIFLAFYKRCSGEFPLLVLDDVLTTVDAQHRMKAAELIIDEFSDRQLVLTTHDERWSEEIKARVNAKGLGGQFWFLNIVGWTVDRGPEIKEIRPTWERVDEFLARGDKKAAGNEARCYLEWILEEMCGRTQAPVVYSYPRKPQLEDFFNGARRRVTSMLRDPGPEAAFNTAFEDVAATKFMANVLSHNNPDGGALSGTEVRALADAVRTLHASFSCAGCHALLVYSRESSELCCPRPACSNRTRFTTR